MQVKHLLIALQVAFFIDSIIKLLMHFKLSTVTKSGSVECRSFKLHADFSLHIIAMFVCFE